MFFNFILVGHLGRYVGSADGAADDTLLRGPVGRGEAAGAAVLVDCAALQHCEQLLRRVRVALWRHDKHHKALPAAVAVRRGVKGAATAGWRQRLFVHVTEMLEADTM